MCSDRNDDESFDSVNVVADATLASQCIYSWIALTCYQLDSLLLIFQFFIVSKTMKEDDLTNFIIHWTWYLEMIGFFVSFFSFLPYVAVILCRFLFDNVSLFCRSISCSQLDYIATLSTTYQDFDASRAVDGNFIQNVFSCSHTDIASTIKEAWLQIDLKRIYSIKYVKFVYSK